MLMTEPLPHCWRDFEIGLEDSREEIELLKYDRDKVSKQFLNNGMFWWRAPKRVRNFTTLGYMVGIQIFLNTPPVLWSVQVPGAAKKANLKMLHNKENVRKVLTGIYRRRFTCAVPI